MLKKKKELEDVVRDYGIFSFVKSTEISTLYEELSFSPF